jgi:hypothetical protein
MAQRYPEAQRGRRGARWHGGVARGGAVGKKHLTGGAQVSAAEREKTLRMECVKPRRKRISQNTPMTRGPSGNEASGPGSREAAWAGVAVARRLGPAGRPRPGGGEAGRLGRKQGKEIKGFPN